MSLLFLYWEYVFYQTNFEGPVPVAARVLRSCVRIPPGAWIFVCCEFCCHVEVSATSWSLVQRSPINCDASLCVIYKTSWMRRPWPTGGLSRQKQKKKIFFPTAYFSICVLFSILWQNGTSKTCYRKVNKWTYVLKCCICVHLNNYSWYFVKNRQSWIILFLKCEMSEWSRCVCKMCSHMSLLYSLLIQLIFSRPTSRNIRHRSLILQKAEFHWKALVPNLLKCITFLVSLRLTYFGF